MPGCRPAVGPQCQGVLSHLEVQLLKLFCLSAKHEEPKQRRKPCSRQLHEGTLDIKIGSCSQQGWLCWNFSVQGALRLLDREGNDDIRCIRETRLVEGAYRDSKDLMKKGIIRALANDAQAAPGWSVIDGP